MKADPRNCYVDNENKIEERRKYLISKKLSVLTRILQFFATAICWVILFLCFRGIFIDVYNYLIGEVETINFPQDIFENFVIYAIVTFLIITIWIFYNKWMFGGSDRRKGFPMPSDEKQALQYGISVQELSLLRSCKKSAVGFNKENRISYIKAKI